MATDERIRCCPDGLVTDRRRRIKVLDCTIRDGGICNDWQFDHDIVRRVHGSLVKAGVDYMEVGYLTKDGEFDPKVVGPWRFCREEDLERIVTEPGRIKLAAMLDVGRVDVDDIRPASESLIDVLRIATYGKDMDEALRLMDRALDQGYEVFMNVMAVTVETPESVDAYLSRLKGSGVHNVAIVDSFGALFPYHVRYLVHKYMNALGENIKVGVHFHNNQQQAFANSIAAIDEGVDFVDATVHGIGRGAGNCPLELLMFYLDNPNQDVLPVLELIEYFGYLRDDLRWGYHLPYAITGFMNLHPRSGMERMTREDRYQVREWYNALVAIRGR